MTAATKARKFVKKDKPIRAMLDVMGGQRSELGELIDKIPPKLFGKGKARVLRKMVLLAIAASTDADGKNGYPSLETIAHRCLVSQQAVSKVILFLKKKKLLKVESKGHKSSLYGSTNLYEILWPETKPKKQEASEDLQIEVVGACKAPTTTEGSTNNNSQEHLQQFDEAPTNISCDNRPSLPPSLPSIRKKEKEAENPSTPPLSLSDSKAQVAASAAHGQDKNNLLTERQDLTKAYFLWLAETWLDLHLTAKERKTINTSILTGNHDLPVLKRATRMILDGLNPSGSFDYAASKLATGLSDKADALVSLKAKEEAQKADMERMKVRMKAQAALELEAIESREAEEEALVQNSLALLEELAQVV